MPSNLLNVDTGFPQLTEEQSAEEKFSVITNYLYMLMEQLRYSMANLGAGNFNDAELDAIGKTITAPIYIDLENAAGAIHELRITADQLTSRMEDAEGNISSIEQYARSITLEVSNGETSSSIKLLADGVAVSSQVIVMDGLVAFKGLEDGTTIGVTLDEANLEYVITAAASRRAPSTRSISTCGEPSPSRICPAR